MEPGGQTAKGRWRAFAFFGTFGGGATWAEGVYEMTYAKVGGVWKISNLDYHSGFGAPYSTGWVPPEPAPAGAAPRGAAGRRLGRYPARRVRRAEARVVVEIRYLPDAADLRVRHLVDAFGPRCAAAEAAEHRERAPPALRCLTAGSRWTTG